MFYDVRVMIYVKGELSEFPRCDYRGAYQYYDNALQVFDYVKKSYIDCKELYKIELTQIDENSIKVMCSFVKGGE